MIERLSLIHQGEGLKDLMTRITADELIDLQKRKVLPNKWYIQRNRRLIPSQPSFTVTSHCLDEIVHPWLDRHITIREAARLQSFPDWYSFDGGRRVAPHNDASQDKYEQVGDAVPPLLAYHIAKSIKKMLQ